MKIWFVDDKKKNRETWKRSFSKEIVENCELHCFCTIGEVIAEFEKENFPEIIFLDCFVTDRYGLEIIDWFKDNNTKKPVFIAHSSMDAANEGMIRKGADFKMEKIKEVSKTQSIVESIKTLENLEFIVRERRIESPADQ